MDHDSTNFFKTVSVVLCLFVSICSFFSATAPSEVPLCPITGWVCQRKSFWIPVEDSFKQAYLEEWVFVSGAPSEKDPAPQIRLKSTLRLLWCRSLLLRHLGSQRSPKIKHVFGNALRHHCLRCSHDPHVNAWNYPSRVMQYCQATRILSHQDLINLLCGVR